MKLLIQSENTGDSFRVSIVTKNINGTIKLVYMYDKYTYYKVNNKRFKIIRYIYDDNKI